MQNIHYHSIQRNQSLTVFMGTVLVRQRTKRHLESFLPDTIRLYMIMPNFVIFITVNHYWNWHFYITLHLFYLSIAYIAVIYNLSNKPVIMICFLVPFFKYFSVCQSIQPLHILPFHYIFTL